MMVGIVAPRTRWALALVLVALCMSLAAAPAQAKTFTVTSTQDFSDVDPGDGICDTIDVQLLNPCTLRGAIQEANAYPGADAIYFDIYGSGVKTIKPTSGLPEVTGRVKIDGYTQPGAKANTIEKGATNATLRIEISGENEACRTCFSSGLRISASRSTVRGLVINRFDGAGIVLSADASANRVEGNFIGTDPSGTLDRGNGSMGVISYLPGGGHTIGGASPGARNLISANGADGVYFDFNSRDNKVIGNLIGTGKNGATPLGNQWDGVKVYANKLMDLIGSVEITYNTIAYNGDNGVLVYWATGNSVLGNSIFLNEKLGIDLRGNSDDDAGNTPNDYKDPDFGANNLQNKPQVGSAETSGPKTTIAGSLNSKPNEEFTIQFFSNIVSNEGQKFIGEKSVTTNANGDVFYVFKPAQAVPTGQTVTATATDPDGNTSEFSAPRAVT